jgi:glycosyltransferase involved in cell wall biosynthesis
VIDSAPAHYLVRDHIDSCILLRARVVRDFHPLDNGFETLRGAIQELMARARRAGFRTLVANRALVGKLEETKGAADLAAQARDRDRLCKLFPEQQQIERMWRSLSVHEYESLLGRAASFSPALRQSLLVDLSSMGPIRNGTTESILGMLRGLHEKAKGWNISLLMSPEVNAYHELTRLLPMFEVEWPSPRSRFTAALAPVQPWSLDDMIRLHRLALFNFFFMHDTILNDMAVDAPPGLEQVWAFLARRADGLIYNSNYTRKRMGERFPVDTSLEDLVSHLAMDPNEYHSGTPESCNQSYIYIVGNDYPHKWMARTVADLTTAFPYLPLRALGYKDPSIPQLSGLESGNLPDEQVDRLYAEARMIVFPSMYEGFGFPIIKGLANGKTVIARKSELLQELAGLYRGPGRLLSFSNSQELVEKVGRVLHGLPVESVPLGGELTPDDKPLSWEDVAGRILGFMEERIRKPECSKWRQREEEIGAMELRAGRI